MDEGNKYKKLYGSLKTILNDNATASQYIDNLLNNAGSNCSSVELNLTNRLSISDLKYYKCSRRIFNNSNQVPGGQNSEVFKINIGDTTIIIKKQPFFYMPNSTRESKTLNDLKKNLILNLSDIQNPAVRDLIFTKKLSNLSNDIPHFPILHKYFVINGIADKFQRRNLLFAMKNIIKSQYNVDYDDDDIKYTLSYPPSTQMEHEIHEIINFYKLHGIRHLFLAMENLDDTLESYFRTNPMKLHETLVIILQVFMSLYYLKSGRNNQGIKDYVHCDLHLLNVMYKREERIIYYNYNGNRFELYTNFVCKIIDNGTSGGNIDGIIILPCHLREANANQIIEKKEIFEDYTAFLDALFNNGTMTKEVADELVKILGTNFKPNELNGRYYFSVQHDFKFMEDLVYNCAEYGIIEY
jgi:hypothetical protein